MSALFLLSFFNVHTWLMSSHSNLLQRSHRVISIPFFWRYLSLPSNHARRRPSLDPPPDVKGSSLYCLYLFLTNLWHSGKIYQTSVCITKSFLLSLFHVGTWLISSHSNLWHCSHRVISIPCFWRFLSPLSIPNKWRPSLSPPPNANGSSLYCRIPGMVPFPTAAAIGIMQTLFHCQNMVGGSWEGNSSRLLI